MTSPSITVVVQDEAWIVDVTVSGDWTQDLRLNVRTTLAKCLAQHPAGILLDLGGLSDPGARSAPLWLNAAMRGEKMDPAVRVAVCLPAGTALGTRLDRVVARRLTPVFRTAPLARSYLTSHRLLLDQVRLHLPPDVSAAARAGSWSPRPVRSGGCRFSCPGPGWSSPSWWPTRSSTPPPRSTC